MSYNETIDSMEFITKFAESLQTMMDEITKYIPLAVVRMSKQMNESMNSIPYKQIVKNYQPLFSQSTMQAISKIQREQIAYLSKQIVEINKMNLLVSQSEITIDKPDDLINDEVAVSMPVETKTSYLAMLKNFVTNHPVQTFFISQFFSHYILDPSWNYADINYTFPTVLNLLKWLVQFIGFP